MEQIFIKRSHNKRLKEGHLWVFSNELTAIPRIQPGTIVEILETGGKSYGYGFYNPDSLIAIRLLKTHDEINTGFFVKRIAEALNFRQRIYPHESMYRLVFGESDYLPGLIVDRYGDYLSIQILSAGMELLKNVIVEALLELLPDTKGIAQKNDSNLRLLEGLPLQEGVIYGSIPDEIQCSENGIKLNVSLLNSQKTGYYLDQRENRLFMRKISRDLKILDCFCNQGGFALNAASGGAKETIGIDSSHQAIETAKTNALANNFYNITFIQDDVLSFLKGSSDAGKAWDLIILDPPAFAKSKKNVHSAIAGYSTINKLALKLLIKGGFLATSSCSQHIKEDVFYEIILKQAINLNKQLRLIYRGSQAPDHPILASMPETNYLKFFVFQLI